MESGDSYPEVCGAAHRPPPQVLTSIRRSPEWSPEILTQRFAEQPTGLLLKFYKEEPGVESGDSYPEVCGAAHRPPPQVL